MDERVTVSTHLIGSLNLGSEELIAVVGAGGKSTLLATLGEEYAASGKKVILTTTTKMGVDQVAEPICFVSDPEGVESKLVAGVPLFVVAGFNGQKVSGISTETADELFADTTADVVIAEADGARRKRFKAPAEHEPVIPSNTTVVVVVAGASALGGSIDLVAHRPERVAALSGAETSDTLTPEVAATVLLHAHGGLKNVPSDAAVKYVITTTDATAAAADALASELNHRASDASVWVWRRRESTGSHGPV